MPRQHGRRNDPSQMRPPFHASKKRFLGKGSAESGNFISGVHSDPDVGKRDVERITNDTLSQLSNGNVSSAAGLVGFETRGGGKGNRRTGSRSGNGKGRGRNYNGASASHIPRERSGLPSRQQPIPSAEELVRRLKSSRSRHERQRALAELASSPNRGQLTVHAYTVVIATAGRDNGWRDALRWLDLMKQEGSILDVFHYSAAINACAKGRQWEQAMLLLDAMSKNDVPPDCVCFNGAIR